MSFQGKRNVYTCNACGSKIVTIDRDEGVTPFAMECKADCGGDMLSGFYRALPSDGEPEWEWYLPKHHRKYKGYRKDADGDFRDYFKNRGLQLRKIAAGASQEGGAGA
jgi:hypothetical protein